MQILDADNLYSSDLPFHLHIRIREHNHRLRLQNTDAIYREKIPNTVAQCPGLFDKVGLKRLPIPR